MLKSPKHPEIEDVEEAIEFYYVEKRRSMPRIADFLGLSYPQVRRILIRRDVRLRRHQGTRTFVDDDGIKTRECAMCNQEQPLIDRYWHRDKKAAGGFKYVCKQCRNQT